MKKRYFLICIIFFIWVNLFKAVDVEEICKDSGYQIYERVELSPNLIKKFTPDMDKGWYGYQFVLDDNYYIDKDELAKDYVFTLNKREKLEEFDTWRSTTSSIVRKSDGKLLAKHVVYSGYLWDRKPFLHELGSSGLDTHCPNGKVGINRSARSHNSKNIVQDVFVNKEYDWTINSALKLESTSKNKFEDLCTNTGINVYEKEIIDASYLLPFPKKDRYKIKNILHYSDGKHYLNYEKLKQEYTLSFRESQLVPPAKNTRVIRSSITRKRDNKLLGESISVWGTKNDSYTVWGASGHLKCSNSYTDGLWRNHDVDELLIHNVFFKARKIKKWKDIDSYHKAYQEYLNILNYEAEMDENQKYRTYSAILPLSIETDNRESAKKYGHKLISLIKDKPEYSYQYQRVIRQMCSKNWERYRDLFIEYCES